MADQNSLAATLAGTVPTNMSMGSPSLISGFSVPSTVNPASSITSALNTGKSFIGGNDFTFDTGVMTPSQWQSFGESGGIVNDLGELTIDGNVVGQLDSSMNLGGSGLAGTLAGAKSIFDIGSSLFGMYNTNKMTNAAIDNYKNMQRIANANEARTQEQYDTFKADKAALNASYGG